jgi:hypothetical protein
VEPITNKHLVWWTSVLPSTSVPPLYQATVSCFTVNVNVCFTGRVFSQSDRVPLMSLTRDKAIPHMNSTDAM